MEWLIGKNLRDYWIAIDDIHSVFIVFVKERHYEEEEYWFVAFFRLYDERATSYAQQSKNLEYIHT
jgi:hypothetical protein